MDRFQFITPIVFIIFNRPDTTAKVFAEIKKAKPAKLFVIADGPRSNRPDDMEKCAASRAIVEMVDWECKIFKNYSDINLGCRGRVSSGLSWVFEQVEDAIILEDDCIPHPSFFRYCQELLEKYRDDCRIFGISGNNFQRGRKRTSYDYYFSRYSHCWGWATWRRAWKHYDDEMAVWPEISKNGWLHDILGDRKLVNYWSKSFQRNYEHQINSWAYRFLFCMWINHGLGILPNVNLVQNIGFGTDATHTKNHTRYSIPVAEIFFPLNHPPYIIRDDKSDRFTESTVYGINSLFMRIVRKLGYLFSGLNKSLI